MRKGFFESENGYGAATAIDLEQSGTGQKAARFGLTTGLEHLQGVLPQPVRTLGLRCLASHPYDVYGSSAKQPQITSPLGRGGKLLWSTLVKSIQDM